MTVSVRDLDRARRDPAVFAELLIGRPLWEHQLEVVRSTARYRVICAGRRAGKSNVFGVLALHQAFAVPGSKVLIVSASESAAKRLFAEVARMASQSGLLRSSVADESKSVLVTTQGSQVECVPASERQVRSAEADLLIVDEAGFVASSIWRAVEPVVVARPGSRVLLCSTPWGDSEHFFRALWTQGMRSPSPNLQAWHWPSTVSPLVDVELLEEIRSRSNPADFAQEYLAEWMDDQGSYFTAAELDAALSDEPMVEPARAMWMPAVAGVDWGFSPDASALTVITGLPGVDERGRARFRVSWTVARHGVRFHEFVDEIAAGAKESSPFGWGYEYRQIVSERNGVGAMPSQELEKRMGELGRGGVVRPVVTTNQLKQDAFGFLKLLLQQGRLELPREPALLRQLRALEFTVLESGALRIAVPERAGHDDLAMSLALAVLPLMDGEVGSPSAVVVPLPAGSWELVDPLSEAF